MFLVDAIGVNQVRGLPFRVDELVGAVASTAPIRAGWAPFSPTIAIGTDPALAGDRTRRSDVMTERQTIAS